MEKSLIIAHRGASGYAPENTISAFKMALEMVCDGIELDVHYSKDGHLIVCHDERVDRTTNGSGFIKDLTLNEIKKLDAGTWFDYKYTNEKIPTLEEVLDIIWGKDILLNIELKNGIIQYQGMEEAVINMVDKYNMYENVIISSFNHYSLLKVKEINKKIKTGVLYVAGLISPWEYAKKINAQAIHPVFHSVNKEIVKECKRNNLQVNTYTVNEEQDIHNIGNMKVSGIITNYPDRAKKIIDEI
ncbi:glycerophosphodiester phosphodiesterase [Caldisalinibacter kiritimatiensis]|uniref:Glycerophosphoryl diester phosphodiesterase n=1 Tax=Caldisalinibacter kiritimatiensis TaxID=1304284 RepID=R1CSL9_9FIRM|nr:glycerophosphodiester phosphodiesterase [Caldisalinibacter kiritimatiensis]EOD01656.1 Glycerophosphoryl diester phosphodiesterase [Caldisalinibacter kiritimatiensis]